MPASQTLYKDRVAETTNTAGTGTLTLAGALTDFQSFNTAFVTGTRVYYTIQGGVDWEVGTGVFTSPSTLTREVVFDSSNAGALVNLPAGGHTVFCDFPAQSIADVGFALAVAQHLLVR
jgi:hypothetical protein